MTGIIDTTIAISMLLSGILVTLIGFEIIKLKTKKPEDEERMVIWRQKFLKHFKIGGIFILLCGAALLVIPSSRNENETWTQSQKEEMKRRLINSSTFLQSLNPDTTDLIATCFVEKYTEKYSLKESFKQEKLPQNEILELSVPIMRECFEQYGIITEK